MEIKCHKSTFRIKIIKCKLHTELQILKICFCGNNCPEKYFVKLVQGFSTEVNHHLQVLKETRNSTPIKAADTIRLHTVFV